MPTSGFPSGSTGKESSRNEGDLGSIPGLGRSPGEGEGYPLQYSGLENSMDCIGYGVTKSQTQLSGFHFQLLASVFLTWLVILNVVTFRNAYFQHLAVYITGRLNCLLLTIFSLLYSSRYIINLVKFNEDTSIKIRITNSNCAIPLCLTYMWSNESVFHLLQSQEAMTQPLLMILFRISSYRTPCPLSALRSLVNVSLLFFSVTSLL